jgi:serine/threonine protein kinase
MVVKEYHKGFLCKAGKEAHILKLLSNSGVIPKYYGKYLSYHNPSYVIMEKIPYSLKTVIQRGWLTQCHIDSLCKAINTIHQRGIHHNDIKLANVMVNQNGDTVLVDFGNSEIVRRPTSNFQDYLLWKRLDCGYKNGLRGEKLISYVCPSIIFPILFLLFISLLVMISFTYPEYLFGF